MIASTPPSPSGSGFADTFKAAGELAGDVGRLANAWMDLAKSEMAVAKISAVRLVGGGVLALFLAFGVWLFSCLALGHWLATLLMRTDLAFAIIAALNLAGIVVLALRMKVWWRAVQMPDSRSALGEIARALSP